MLYDARGVFTRSTTLALGALALALGACEAQLDEGLPPPAGESRPMATTTLAELTGPTGNRVEFLALDESSILVSEHGSSENPPVTKEPDYVGLSAVAIYQKLAPGAPVPQALLDTQERIDRLMAVSPRRNVEADLSVEGDTKKAVEYETVEQQLTARQFRDRFCRCGNWAKGNLCETDASGVRRLRTDDVHYFDADVNALSSDVGFTIMTRKWWAWGTHFQARLRRGEERFFHFSSGVADWDISADTAGSRYHFHARAYNGLRACR